MPLPAVPYEHGCQMAIAGFLESYVFGPSGSWTMAPLRYAAKFVLFLSLDCAPSLHPGAIQGMEGFKFCHLATRAAVPSVVGNRATGFGLAVMPTVARRIFGEAFGGNKQEGHFRAVLILSHWES